MRPSFDKKYSSLSEIELIKLFRNEQNQRIRSKIFNVFLHKKFNDKKSWHERINYIVNKNKLRLNYHNCYFDAEDLYQDIICALMKMLSNWFDVESDKGCSSYILRTIETYCNRVFQSMKTFKRKLNVSYTIEVNDEVNDSKKVHEMISDQNDSSLYKTFEKKTSFDKILAYHDLFNFLKDMFKQEPVNVSSKLYNKIIIFINEKRKDNELVKIASEFNKKVEQIKNLKDIIEKNIEKQMFLDILIIMKKDLKSEVLMKRYNCTKDDLTKVRQKFSSIAERKLKEVGISLNDFLGE
jgi:hypothetical protein